MPGKQFTVRFDVDLPQETIARIERTIQAAVLNELANVDVADEYSINLRPGKELAAAGAEDRDGPSGIWVRGSDSPAVG